MQEKTIFRRIIKIIKVQLTRPGRQERIKQLEIELGIREPEPEILTIRQILSNDPIYRKYRPGFVDEGRNDLEYARVRRAQQLALNRGSPREFWCELDLEDVGSRAARREDSIIIDSCRGPGSYSRGIQEHYEPRYWTNSLDLRYRKK